MCIFISEMKLIEFCHLIYKMAKIKSKPGDVTLNIVKCN